MQLEYRWSIPYQLFLDWSFLDFSQEISFTTLRIGGYLKERISLYNVLSPATFISDGYIKRIASEKIMQQTIEFMKYFPFNKAPLFALLDQYKNSHFFMADIAATIGSRLSFPDRTTCFFNSAIYLCQISYGTAARIGVFIFQDLLAMRSDTQLFYDVAKVFFPTYVRNRLSVWGEFHKVNVLILPHYFDRSKRSHRESESIGQFFSKGTSKLQTLQKIFD